MSSFSVNSIPFTKPVIQMAISNHANNPILALLLPSMIIFYDSQGELVEGKDIQRRVQATVMEWHPVQKVLAVGWKNGVVSLYTEENSNLPFFSNFRLNPR